METELKHCTLSLDVARADLSAFAPLQRSIAARGIQLVTLAEEQKHEPDWLALFCEMDNETRRGDIGTPRTVDQMAERLEFLGVEPERLFLAKHEGKYIGYTLLNRQEGDHTCLRQGWTGVRPEYRRQGVATALKICGIAYAQEQGYLRIITQPRIANTASIEMNRKVGFELLPLW